MRKCIINYLNQSWFFPFNSLNIDLSPSKWFLTEDFWRDRKLFHSKNAITSRFKWKDHESSTCAGTPVKTHWRAACTDAPPPLYWSPVFVCMPPNFTQISLRYPHRALSSSSHASSNSELSSTLLHTLAARRIPVCPGQLQALEAAHLGVAWAAEEGCVCVGVCVC